MRFYCGVFFLMLIYGQVGAQTAVRGNIDLSQVNLKNGPIEFSGEWEFYWNQLLSPEDFNDSLKPAFIRVPGSWHRQGYPVLGYGTYRTKVILPSPHQSLSLYFPIINSSAKIWVNNVLVEESGKLSDHKSDFKPRLSSTVVTFPEDIGREIYLTVQAANFAYFSGGIAGTPLLDTPSATYFRMNRSNGIENFFAGSLIAMFFYQVILYFLYHRGKPYLWLALICLGVALRALIVHGGSFLLPNLFPDVGWETWKKIEFGAVYGIVTLFPLYVYHLFIDHAPRWPMYFFVTLSILLCSTVLLTPQYVYGRFLEFAHFGLLFGFFYAVYSISKAWRYGNKDARTILLGVVASFPFILAEILKNSRFFPVDFQFMYLVEMGVLVFLLFQVYLLANHYAKSYTNLELLNQNLEKIVEERSGELITANSVKDRLLSVMSHDIKSPLNSLRGILQLYNRGSISQNEFMTFTQHIENDLSKTSILVENILYWTASQLKGVQVHHEPFDLPKLIFENVSLFETIAANKKISIEHNCPPGLTVNSDKNIINLVMRNVISNAIKFSFEGGKISLTVKQTPAETQIEVKDQGIGMDEDTLETLLAPELVVSATGTRNEKGTGLGLALCREYLERAGGELTVESAKGQGSKFTITIPAHTVIEAAND
jgi:two-component system sensor histidine kinase ChiS